MDFALSPTSRLGKGTVTQTLLAPDPDTFVSEPQPRIELTWGGVTGDRHCGHTRGAGGRERHFPAGTELLNLRQVSILSEQENAQVAAKLDLPELPAADLGANLVLDGIPGLSYLPAFTSLWFPSGAVLLVTSINPPCKHPGRALQARYPDQQALPVRFVAAARGLRGLVAIVYRPGIIEPGDRVAVHAPADSQ